MKFFFEMWFSKTIPKARSVYQDGYIYIAWTSGKRPLTIEEIWVDKVNFKLFILIAGNWVHWQNSKSGFLQELLITSQT